MKHLETLLAACLALSPAILQAGGLTEPEIVPEPLAPAPEARPIQDWTGFYLGGQIGRINADFIGTGGIAVSGASGGTYGIHAGYNHDFGTLVLGVELDHVRTDLGFDIPVVGGGSVPGPTLDGITRLKLRAGVDLGRILAYGTVGLARPDASLTDFDDGTVYGLGATIMATPHWLVGVEALRQDFDGTPSLLGIEATTFDLRLSYKF